MKAPTLVLWGRRDHALQPGLAEASLELCEDGHLRWFHEATHWVQHEEADAVTSAIDAFFRASISDDAPYQERPLDFNPA